MSVQKKYPSQFVLASYAIGTLLLGLLASTAKAGEVIGVYPTENATLNQQKPYTAFRPQQRPKHYLMNYYGLNYAYLSYDTAGISSVNPSQLLLQVGAHFTPSTSLEGRIAVVNSDVEVRYGTQTAKQQVKSFLGAYVRHGFINLSGFEIYGLAGITQTESQAAVVVNNYMSTITQSSMDVSYGLGTRFKLGGSQRVTGNIEYNRLVTQNSLSISSLNLGFNVYF